MKHIFILSGLLLLSACASTGDAQPVSTNSRYLEVRASNSQITGLSQTVTNRSEIVAHAKAMGLYNQDTSSAVSVAGNRYANAGHSNNADSRDKIPVFNNQYNIAKNAFEKMYAIYTTGFEGISIEDIKNAYMISGGSVDDFTWDATLTDDDKNSIAMHIKTAVEAEHLLDKFFDKDSENPDKYLITDRSQDLSDINFVSPDGTNNFSFVLDEHGEIVSVKLSGEDFSRRNRGTQFVKTIETDEQTDTVIASIVGYGLKNKLKYSDFGMINKTTSRDYTDETLQDILADKKLNVFAGGYSLKAVSRENVVAMNQEMDFSGTAVGVVTGKDGTQQRIASNALLNFKDGTETLDMNFSAASNDAPVDMKWYHVFIVNNGTDSEITFRPAAPIGENYQLSGVTDTAKTIDNYDGASIKYYGENGVASEFGGTAKYYDGVENGVKMDVAFGGALVKPSASE